MLFIDAAQPDYFRAGKAQNFLDPAHVSSIVEAFCAFAEVERFAHVADLEEIAANDFNLNISRYVDTTEPVEVLSVEEALAQLREAEQRRDEAGLADGRAAQGARLCPLTGGTPPSATLHKSEPKRCILNPATRPRTSHWSTSPMVEGDCSGRHS